MRDTQKRLEHGRWYRVQGNIGNPLNGCDVQVYDDPSDSAGIPLLVLALRRIDMIIGDRPYQLRDPDGLGVYIDRYSLVDSPIQDDVVEIATDSPYGKFIDSNIFPLGKDGLITMARYERAVQATYNPVDGDPKNRTYYGAKGELDQIEMSLMKMHEDGQTEELIYQIVGGDS